MTKSLEEIQQKEQQLALKIEQLEEETKHVNQIEEEYEEFFHHTSALFTEIEEQFSQNSFNEFLSDRHDGLHHQRFHIFGDIDEERQQLHKQ